MSAFFSKVKEKSLYFWEKGVKLFKKYELLLFVIVIVALALYMRIKCFDWESRDFNVFLTPWYNDLKANGGFKAMKVLYPADHVNCDYPPLYMYLLAIFSYTPVRAIVAIKSISVFFDFVLAVFIGLIARKITKSDMLGVVCFSALLFLPTVFINSALWGQCDVIYTCFIVISLYFLMCDKDYLSISFYALSFCLKIQSIFFLPIIIIAIIKKKIRLCALPLFVIIYALVGIPAVIFGCGFEDAYFMFFTQMGRYSDLTLNTPNMYNWFGSYSEKHEMLSMPMTCFAVGVTGVSMLPLYKLNFDTKDNKIWVAMACYFAVMMPFVIPHMHERYWYVSDVLCILFVLCFAKKWYAALCAFLPSLYVVCCYMFGVSGISLVLLAIMMCIGVVLMGINLFNLVKESAVNGENIPENISENISESK